MHEVCFMLLVNQKDHGFSCFLYENMLSVASLRTTLTIVHGVIYFPQLLSS